MSLTYVTFTNSLATLMVATTSDVNFTTVLPDIIDYAELRCYRDLDLLNTVARDSSAALTVNSRDFPLPSSVGTFVVVEQMNVITPSTQTTANLGTRNSLTPVSRETLDALYPSVSGSTVPSFFSLVTNTAAIVGPWPNATYTVEVIGTIRPPSLATAVTTTLLSVYFPDLFLAAAAVWGFGYQRDFGGQANDPQTAQSWENQYQTLLRSAQVEETRKRFGAEGWSPKSPDPIATPPRT